MNCNFLDELVFILHLIYYLYDLVSVLEGHLTLIKDGIKKLRATYQYRKFLA